MKKYILLLIIPLIGFSQIRYSETNNNNYKGPILESGISLSYFGNSVKTHWDIEVGWLFQDDDGSFGLAVSLEGLFDSKTYDASISTYNQQSAFVNLKFLFAENLALFNSLSFGWLVKDDANIFHKGGNVDCFRIMYSCQVNSYFSLFGAYYFDKDDETEKRHDLPSIGISLGF